MHYLILSGVLATLALMALSKMFTVIRKPIGKGTIFGNCYGEIGGGVSGKTDYSKTSQEQQNQYTQEQKDYMANLLNRSTPTTNTLLDTINAQLNAGLSGQPTVAEKAQTLQEKQGVDNSYKDLATQATEALAGRGTTDSGVANKVMANLGTQKAVANQTADTNSLARQKEDLLSAIKVALGITSLSSGLSTDVQGVDAQQSSHGTGWGGNFNSKVSRTQS